MFNISKYVHLHFSPKKKNDLILIKFIFLQYVKLQMAMPKAGGRANVRLSGLNSDDSLHD